MDFATLVGFFKDWSGRADLSDEVITHYLNAGQRFLDDMAEFPQTASRYIMAGTIGSFYTALTAQAKSINRIELVDGGEHHRVVELSLKELQLLSPQLPSSNTAGLPTFFAMAAIRKVSGAVPAEQVGKLAVIETGTTSDKLGLVFNCPFDKAYTVDIYGNFYSPTIVEGADPDTFWAIQYPMTLVHSALYKLEITTRNTEGAKDWLFAIQATSRGIAYNVAEQISNNTLVMEG